MVAYLNCIAIRVPNNRNERNSRTLGVKIVLA